jgi:hypothetical protein
MLLISWVNCDLVLIGSEFDFRPRTTSDSWHTLFGYNRFLTHPSSSLLTYHIYHINVIGPELKLQRIEEWDEKELYYPFINQ